MPAKNIAKSADKMPNGQDRGVYTQQAHEFLNTHYKRLLKYAKYETRRNPDRSLDVLQSTCCAILEGRSNIRFDKFPLTYAHWMMKREVSRMFSSRAKKFESDLLPVPDCAAEEKAHEDVLSLVEELRPHLPQLKQSLTVVEAQHLEWWIDRVPYKDISQIHKVSKERVRKIREQVATKIRKNAVALFPTLKQGYL